MAKLTSRSGADSPAARAGEQVLRRWAGGELPVGLRQLSAILLDDRSPAAPASGVAETAEPLIEVLRRHPCVVVRAPDVMGVTESLAAMVGDGKRVLVSGGRAAGWTAARDALPKSLRGLCLEGPLPLSDTEQRELRALLLTATESRRARPGQVMPPPGALPEPERVGWLCRALGGADDPVRDAVELIPTLLGELDSARLTSLAGAARLCQDALRGLDGAGTSSWSRPLLERLLFGEQRAEFESLLLSTGEVVDAANALQGPAYRMAMVGPLPPEAVERLGAYIEFLESGGTARRHFPSLQQRAVTPVLRQLGLERAALHEIDTLRQALTFLRLTRALHQAATLCRQLRVPEPKPTPAAVARRHRELERIEQAARAVETLRHEVLFMHPNSPVAVPDLATTVAVAGAILDAAALLPLAKAELSELADKLVESMPDGDRAPEVADLLVALRAGNLPDYLRALARLETARHEQAEQARQVELLARLREGAPALADAWEEPDTHRYTQGTARFSSLDELLSELPPADIADVVVLLDGQTLGPESLLAAAAASRLVVASTAPIDGAGQRASAASAEPRPDTALEMLLRASVPVVRSPATGPTPSVPLQRGAPPGRPPRTAGAKGCHAGPG